jgi:hypothetical protein
MSGGREAAGNCPAGHITAENILVDFRIVLRTAAAAFTFAAFVVKSNCCRFAALKYHSGT